jgi:hypothetical protein
LLGSQRNDCAISVPMTIAVSKYLCPRTSSADGRHKTIVLVPAPRPTFGLVLCGRGKLRATARQRSVQR